MRIVLFGMKHCGKSTLGRGLARQWNCPFYDVDNLIEESFESEAGPLTVREIFAKYGNEVFAMREESVVYKLARELDALCEHRQNPAYVVALGGRTPLNRRLSQVLKRMGLNIFLRVNPDETWNRVTRSGIPSFLTSSNPREEFLLLYREREPLYQRQADLTISLDGLSHEQSLQKLIRLLEERYELNAEQEED